MAIQIERDRGEGGLLQWTQAALSLATHMEKPFMKRALTVSTMAIAGLLAMSLSAWALQMGPMPSPPQMGPMEGLAPVLRNGDPASRVLSLLESDRVKTALGLTDDQIQRLRQIVEDTEKSAIKTQANLQVAGIELEELLRSNNPDRNAVNGKVQEIANYRGAMLKEYVGALLDAKTVLTPDQQKKIEAFIEQRQPQRGGMAGPMGPGRMMFRRRNGPGMPPAPGNMPPAPPAPAPQPSGR